MVPKGAIQSIVKSLQPIEELNNAQAIPKTRPIIICTGSDGFKEQEGIGSAPILRGYGAFKYFPVLQR